MPNFKFTARTKDGKLRRGFLEARNKDDLIDILQARGLIVVSFESAQKAQIETKPKRRFHTKVKLDDLIVFARQLTALINAGVTLLRSLEITSEQITSRHLQRAMAEIKKDVAAGSSLRDAIAKHPKIFSKFWVNVVATGETTGQLGFALEELSRYLESTAAFKRKITSALIYPAVILSVAIAAILVFIIRIIPMFSDIYSGFGAQLPVFSQIVFNISSVIKKYILLELAAVAGIIFLFRFYRKTPLGRRNTDKFLLDAPVIGDVVRQIAAIRFARGLGMLVKSGTPILHAMDIVIEISGNVIIMDMLVKVKENVRAGKAMAAPLIEAGIFPEMLSHMLSVGEESGELAGILDKAAEFYQERTDAYISRLTALFEPALIVIIGVVVGTLVIAMYLPIFGLAGAVK